VRLRTKLAYVFCGYAACFSIFAATIHSPTVIFGILGTIVEWYTGEFLLRQEKKGE